MDMEKELESYAQEFLGNYGWMFIAGIAIFTFRSAIEGIVEGLKVFIGNDLNTDDVVTIDERPARVVRVGIFKTTFFVYNIGCAKGKPYVKGGAKMQIQNSVLKNHKIEKPLPMLDLSKWEEECKDEQD
jgi:hypothetical protein